MLLDTLTQDVNNSLKSGDKVRTETLRYLIAAIKKFEIDTYPPGSSGKLTEDDVVKILRRQVKTHEESITAFTKGNRQDLVEKEQKELEVLKAYLPKEMDDEEIRKIVKEVVATGVANFGQVMGMVMKKVSGQASGDRVASIVRKEIG